MKWGQWGQMGTMGTNDTSTNTSNAGVGTWGLPPYLKRGVPVPDPRQMMC